MWKWLWITIFFLPLVSESWFWAALVNPGVSLSKNINVDSASTILDFRWYFSNSFWPIADADTLAYLSPLDCREHKVSPVVELTYYNDNWQIQTTNLIVLFLMYAFTGQNKTTTFTCLLKRVVLRARKEGENTHAHTHVHTHTLVRWCPAMKRCSHTWHYCGCISETQLNLS